MSEDTLTVEAPKGNYGNTGGNGGGTRDTSYQGSGITILKPGDVEDGPFGRVIINAQGNIVMNGVIMTEENTETREEMGAGHVTQVIKVVELRY